MRRDLNGHRSASSRFRQACRTGLLRAAARAPGVGAAYAGAGEFHGLRAQAARAAHCGHREDSEIPLFPDYAFVCRPLVPWRGAIDNGRRSTGEGFRPGSRKSAAANARGRSSSLGACSTVGSGYCSRDSPGQHVTITPVYPIKRYRHEQQRCEGRLITLLSASV